MQTYIRDYKIKHQLGEGGMGKVYLAEDTMLEKDVALKVLNPQLTSDDQFTQRFKQEAKLQASLIHPNIVALHTLFHEGNNYCMVMEYAAGKTIKELVRETGPIPEERALRIFRQMLEGVGYAHSRGIIHRDIKPSNVIVDERDDVKIMDFGIAKIMGDKGLTKTGAKLGTVYYMSPEQIRAEKDIDQRTDIYSLGITLYEMLTGRVPFNTDTESDFEIMNEIVNSELRDPRDYNERISEKSISAIKEMTRKIKEERPKTCHIISEIIVGNHSDNRYTKTSQKEYPKCGSDMREEENVLLKSERNNKFIEEELTQSKNINFQFIKYFTLATSIGYGLNIYVIFEIFFHSVVYRIYNSVGPFVFKVLYQFIFIFLVAFLQKLVVQKYSISKPIKIVTGNISFSFNWMNATIFGYVFGYIGYYLLKMLVGNFLVISLSNRWNIDLIYYAIVIGSMTLMQFILLKRKYDFAYRLFLINLSVFLVSGIINNWHLRYLTIQDIVINFLYGAIVGLGISYSLIKKIISK